jgi:hypothetical protein
VPPAIVSMIGDRRGIGEGRPAPVDRSTQCLEESAIDLVNW